MDADLLLAATYGGDTGAFESLVRSQAARLHRIASRVTGDGALADDVLQETFLRILRVPPAARPSRAAAAWLARVTVRVALNILESEGARRRREKRYATERSREMKDGAPSEAALPRDSDRAVAEALASLSPETRAALWLHVVEGEGVREVARCLQSSRSAVSRRIRAGLESLRLRLATSGVALAGASALRGPLRGSEVRPPESLVRRVVDAGRTAMAGPAAASQGPDALDAALAAPVRSLPSLAGIGAAAAIGLGLLAVIGGLLLPGPGSEPAGEPAVPVVRAPALPPPGEAPVPASAEKPVEPASPPAPPSTASVGGTIRDENGEPVASADVYLALTPPRDEDLLVSLGSFFRPDYFQRSRFLRTTTDGQGRYLFEGIRELGDARLGAFKEDHAGPREAGSTAQKAVKIEEGAARTDVDLVMAGGKTLAGRVLSMDGAPVADAVVSVPTAWTPTDHVFWPAGLAPTGADGRFRLGVEPRTAACHLRVNSDNRGQGFFIEVPVTDDPVELVLGELARVEGTITWADGTPASGLTVTVNGRLPEPPIPVSRMGMRSHVVHDGPVGGDGTYAIDGLHPRLDYDIFIIDGSPGRGEALRSPLTPPLRHSFRLEPGEVKVWDHAVSKPITIRGRIRTERTGTPLPEGQVGLRKDGKRLALLSIHADQEGFFEHRLNTGPGEYRIHAEPPVGFPASEAVADLIDARFGKTLHLSGSEEVEVDLAIFEPGVLPVRVLDHAGEPVRSCHARLGVTFPGGKTMRHDAPRSLDDTGRTSFLFHHPAAEIRLEISGARGGPVVETSGYAIQPGAVLPEATVVLPRTCDLTASVLDPSGEPHRERRVTLRVIYQDGSRQDLAGRTDEEGRLDEKGLVRAVPLVVEVRSAKSTVPWKSPPLDGGAAQVLDLGNVVLEGDDDP